jgi:hypothetical protein
MTGNAAISYYDSNGNLDFATQTGSTWNTPQVVDTSVGTNYATSLAFDPRCGNPAIAYYDAGNDALKYAYQPASPTWNIQIADITSTVDNGNGPVGPVDVGPCATLAFDASGTPHIAYFENNGYYSALDDQIDYNPLMMYAVGTPYQLNQFALPESALGTGMALAVSLIALAGFTFIQKRKNKII